MLAHYDRVVQEERTLSIEDVYQYFCPDTVAVKTARCAGVRRGNATENVRGGAQECPSSVVATTPGLMTCSCCQDPAPSGEVTVLQTAFWTLQLAAAAARRTVRT